MKRLAVMKAQFNIERFVIIQELKCGSFNIKRMMAMLLTHGIIIPFSEGMIYLIAWAIAYYF